MSDQYNNPVRWTIDADHSRLEFAVKYEMISTVRGHFKDYEVEIVTDGEDLSTAQVELVVQADSLTTDNPERDAQLRGPDFFDVDTYPTITFNCAGMTKTGEDTYELEGELAIKHVTRKVKFEAEFQGFENGFWGERRAGISFEGKLDRFDFNLKYDKVMDAGAQLVGETVVLEIETELIQLKPETEEA